MAEERKFIDTGKRLQALRKNTLKMTAEDFAASIGVSVKLINAMEGGWKNVSSATLKKIHRIHNIPADTVLSGRTYIDGAKPKPSDPLTMEIQIAKLEARVDQLERLIGHLMSTKKFEDA